MFKAIEPFFTLMESGGGVLWVLFAIGMLLVSLYRERIYFYKYEFQELVKKELELATCLDRSDWRAIFEREYHVSRLKSLLRKRVSLIEVITFMCPLFGLLGTVTGMIAVFDVMAHKGLGNPRLMAGGVSQATLPTMVSMIIALIGLIGLNRLKSVKNKLELKVAKDFDLNT
jgi:biopolymer transport protein ExbB